MLDRLNEDFRFYQQALALRAQRQEVLSSNIANADTPNYKARDIDFKAAMQAAIEGTMRLPDTSLKLTSARHIPAKAVSQGPTDLLYRLPYQPSMDGNTVTWTSSACSSPTTRCITRARCSSSPTASAGCRPPFRIDL